MAFPATYNFRYYRGDTYQFILRPKNADGTNFDLTPFMYNAVTNPNNVRFVIANQRGTGVSVVSYPASGAVDDSDDTVTCTITPDVGDDLTASITWVYDVQIADAVNDIVYTLLTGTISVTDDISGAP
jgi:hypothetical protein